MKNKIISLIFRFGGISGKFLLVFLMTKYISLEFQGEYTIISSTIAILIMFLGFDFYVFSNKIIVKNPDKALFSFKNSLVFFTIGYLFLIPILFLLFQYSKTNINLLIIIYFLILAEHFSQELFRLHIALNNISFSNLLFFIRTGTWSWLLVFYIYFNPNSTPTINDILGFWMIFSFVSVVFGIMYVPNIKSFFAISIDKLWIKKGIKIGATMFISTFFLKIIEYSDRYFITIFLNKTELGVYAFFFQIANVVNVVIFTLYISYAYPKILKAVYETNLVSLNKEKKKITLSSIIIIILFCIGTLIFLPFVLEYIGKEQLNSRVAIVYLLLCSALFFNLSYASHFVLIAKERELDILKATLIACVINVILNLTLIPFIGIYGSATALIVSNLVMLVTKRYYENLIDLPND